MINVCQILDAFFDANRLLGQSLHQALARIAFRLNPDQLVILDNQMVLHGRSSCEQGVRHLQGCYADQDALRSKIRVLEGAS